MLKSKKIKNPIYFELKKLNLISDKNLDVINGKTRDKKIKVIIDKKTKIIFLEKYITTNKYYSSLKHKDDKRQIIEKSKGLFANVKTRRGSIRIASLDDDNRRRVQFKRILKNKNILDFGCGWGGFLKNLKNYKSLSGIELRLECIRHIRNKIKKVNISNNINYFQKKFDVITMFHVLEHLPFQIDTLKVLNSRLKKKGKIIIEVPHANDFLIQQKELKEFKDFTFWSEHLILHTYQSLKTILKKSGFKKINISFYQRYNFANHLGWFLKKKPGGHKLFEKFINKNLEDSYSENLKRLRQTDTLIAIAEKI